MSRSDIGEGGAKLMYKAVRAHHGQPHLLVAGEYTRHSSGRWYACTLCGLLANLGSHQVVEHEDGSISVTPSIAVSNGALRWRGFITNGMWRDC